MAPGPACITRSSRAWQMNSRASECHPALSVPLRRASRQAAGSARALHATVRAAVGTALQLAPRLPLFAGGKSFGGRMTSQAQAVSPLAQVRGIVFLGFPLHPPKQPSEARAEHLFKVGIPLLFLQGTHDAFAELSLLQPLAMRLGERATLTLFQDADHSFHVSPAPAAPTHKCKPLCWEHSPLGSAPLSPPATADVAPQGAAAVAERDAVSDETAG